ncbi:MAG: hypothetical protein ACKOD8_06960 [Limnohabitans sp.]
MPLRVFDRFASVAVFAATGGGALMKAGGATVLFQVCGLATFIWLLVAWFMEPIEAPAR